MRTLPVVVALAALTLLACAEPMAQAPGPVVSRAAALDQADSGDRADHDCQVVLRYLWYDLHSEAPADGGDEGSRSRWRGFVEVDAGADIVSAHVLFRDLNAEDAGDEEPVWLEVAATGGAVSDETPGSRRYDFVLPAASFEEGAPAPAVELVAFTRGADGGRLFDHNSLAGDLENVTLRAEGGYGSWSGHETCRPPVGSVHFTKDWRIHRSGELRRGGWLRVDYALERLPDCRGTHNGHPAWDLVAHGRFLPGGQPVEGSVSAFVAPLGVPTTEVNPRPLLVQVPDDAEQVELWFHNYTGAGSSCEAWDSNWNANYRFDVWPDEDHPRCQDLEKDQAHIHSESDLMVHNAPHCLAYDLDAQHDAGHCELHVEGFGAGYLGHYGIPHQWLVGFVRLGQPEGEVLNVGLFTRSRDDASGEPVERFSLGVPEAEGVWKVGFTHLRTSFYDEGFDVTVEELAFFVDVRRPSGEVVRLWESRGGANYTWGDAFGMPTTKQYIAYGNVEWANQDAAIYDSRRACR